MYPFFTDRLFLVMPPLNTAFSSSVLEAMYDVGGDTKEEADAAIIDDASKSCFVFVFVSVCEWAPVCVAWLVLV